MPDYSSISSHAAAQQASESGQLVKILLLPAELGGSDIARNVVFVPPTIAKIKQSSDLELFAAIREGLSEVSVVPEYRGASFVPSRIKMTAARPNATPEFELVIVVW
jgi:hypothetical protein